MKTVCALVGAAIIAAFVFLVMWSIIASGAAVTGYVVTKYWEWFVIPLFPDLKPLGLLSTIALIMMARLIIPTYLNTSKDDDKKKKKRQEKLPVWALEAITQAWRNRNGRGKENDLPSWVMKDMTAMLKNETPKEKGEEKAVKFPLWLRAMTNVACLMWGVPMLFLLVGWILHSFM